MKLNENNKKRNWGRNRRQKEDVGEHRLTGCTASQHRKLSWWMRSSLYSNWSVQRGFSSCVSALRRCPHSLDDPENQSRWVDRGSPPLPKRRQCRTRINEQLQNSNMRTDILTAVGHFACCAANSSIQSTHISMSCISWPQISHIKAPHSAAITIPTNALQTRRWCNTLQFVVAPSLRKQR